MRFRTSIVSTLGAAGLAAAAMFYAPVAAADRVGFNVTFGGPGYAVSVGNHGVGLGYYGPPAVYPAPVVVAPPYVAPYPPTYYRPYRPYVPYYTPVVVPRPIVVRPYGYRHDYRDDRRHYKRDGYRDHRGGRDHDYRHYGR